MSRFCQCVTLVALSGICVLTFWISHESVPAPLEAICIESAFKLKECDANCYSKDACTRFLEAAREAAGLRESFEIELRHHLHLLKEARKTFARRTSGLCHISKSDWHLKSRRLKSAINGTRGCTSCNLELTSTSDLTTCAALVKQLECAVSRIVVTYGSRKVCLNSTSYGACRSTIEFVIRESAELDVVYRTVLLERKEIWDDIKLRLQSLNQTMWSLRDSYGCPKGTACDLQQSLAVNLDTHYVTDVERNYDDSWSVNDEGEYDY